MLESAFNGFRVEPLHQFFWRYWTKRTHANTFNTFSSSSIKTPSSNNLTLTNKSIGLHTTNHLLKNNKVAIVGAGIGGVALALLLSRSGIEVVIYEQRKVFSEGTGLILTPNSLRVFRELGFLEDIVQSGEVLRESSLRNRHGAILSTIDSRSFEDSVGLPTIGIHRGRLLDVLRDHLPDEIAIVNCHKLSNIARNNDILELQFDDESIEKADFVVGCDGLYSSTREFVLDSPPPLRYSGYICWRGICKADGIKLHNSFFESWGDGKRFGAVEIGKNEIYWFATFNVSEGTRLNQDKLKTEILDLYSEWHSPIQDIISATCGQNILCHDIYDREPSKCWFRDNVVLLGDAVHSTLPVLGQGASMAIESSFILNEMLLTHPTISEALVNYQKIRKPRTDAVTRQSHLVSRIGQWENAMLSSIRDLAMQFTPEFINRQQMNWLFAYDVSSLKKGGRHD